MTSYELLKILKIINNLSKEDLFKYFKANTMDELIRKIASTSDLLAFYEDYKYATSFMVAEQVRIKGTETYGWITFIGESHTVLLLDSGEFRTILNITELIRTGKFNMTLSNLLSTDKKDCEIVNIDIN